MTISQRNREPQALDSDPTVRADAASAGPPPHDGRTPIGRRDVGVIVVIALYLLVYGAWQILHWGGLDLKQAIGDAAFWPVNALGVVMCWRLAMRQGYAPRVRRAWWLIGAGVLAYLVGDVVQFVYESVLNSRPYPSWADPAYLAFYPLTLIGILQFPRSPLDRATRIKSVFDGAALLLGSAAVVWFTLLAPTALAAGQSQWQTVFSVAYPCGDLALLFGVGFLVIAKGRSLVGLSLATFTNSLLFFVVADLIYGRLTLNNAYAGGDRVDALWMIAISLMTVSAVLYGSTTRSHPQIDQGTTPPDDSSFFAYVATAVVFVLMALSIGFKSLTTFILVCISGATVVLVLARLRWLSTAKRRQEQYFHALVERVSDFVVVLDADFTPTYASPPLLELVGLPTESLVGELNMPAFILDEDVPLVLAGLQRAVASPDARITTEVRVMSANGGLLNVVGVTTNLLDDPAVRGLVVVLHDVTERSRLEEELRHQALHDVLTGLPNRALIHDRLSQNLAAARRSRSAIAVMFVDLDNFKDVNDSLGHATGDELLRAVATRLESLARGQDTVGRVGGDEFVLLAQGGLETAVLLAQRVLDVMVEPYVLESAPGRTISIGASIGISVGTDADSTSLLRNADLALYQAKRDGKGRFALFEEKMFERAQERLLLENDLSSALADNEFFLVYQPVIDLNSNAPFGVEALLRWQHPWRGVVPPLDFIPLLEERGLIIEVGRWVLRRACEQGVRWRHEGRAITVSVNASPVQLMDSHFADDVQSALHDSGFAPERLVIEITESVLMREPVKVAAALQRLKASGIRIAVDDFGTGYSSLTYLRQFPIDILKIDQSFVRDMQESKEAATVVRTLIHLGTELGIDTIAEGIEHTEQMASLRDDHCDYGQGFLIARPMPVEDVGEFFDEWRQTYAPTQS
jgi:diguanylate cyclase (GGDEF)-like protein/PAS domain S-box-containing protein